MKFAVKSANEICSEIRNEIRNERPLAPEDNPLIFFARLFKSLQYIHQNIMNTLAIL